MIGKPNKIALVNTKAEDVGWFITWLGSACALIGLSVMTVAKVVLTPKEFADMYNEAAERIEAEKE